MQSQSSFFINVLIVAGLVILCMVVALCYLVYAVQQLSLPMRRRKRKEAQRTASEESDSEPHEVGKRARSQSEMNKTDSMSVQLARCKREQTT